MSKHFHESKISFVSKNNPGHYYEIAILSRARLCYQSVESLCGFLPKSFYRVFCRRETASIKVDKFVQGDV